MAINHIGIKLGYDYQSHFCTAFTRKYGVSPIEYRAMQHAKMLNMRMFSVDVKERNVILFQLSVNIICISSSLALLFTDASFTSER